MGKYVQLGGSKKPVGYCYYHKRTLSENQLKAKECLNKQCNALKKYDHPFWAKRELKKQMRKERKNAKRDKET